MQGPHTFPRSAIEAKLDLAQDVLNLSNENIQLTMGLLLVDPDELASLLARLAANRARISILLQKIREQVESEKERELLDASSARWSAPRNERQSARSRPDRREAAPVSPLFQTGWP